MVRTQLYLTKRQHEALRRGAARAGLSMTELVRRLIDRQFVRSTGREVSKEAVMSFIGLGESGRADISERHDEALREAFRATRLR